MNGGVISTRYARALLQLTQESGRGEQVFSQARSLLADPSVAPSPLEDDLTRLVLLLRRNGRGNLLRFILNDFVRMYCDKAGVLLVHLTSAVEAPGLPERISSLLGAKTGRRVVIESAVDPSLMGGFVLEVDDRQLDASVRTQLERIRSQFIEKNNRIV